MKETKQSGFGRRLSKLNWQTSLCRRLDLAAVALAVTLPATNLPQIGGLDGGQFMVI
ncbi:hypothetical protein PO124_33710 [Bacillus licheniformis]|nr:hypothetical protein [Bacillus licheniformis]